MDYWRGQRICWPHVSNYKGGPAPPPPAPTPSSYAYAEVSFSPTYSRIHRHDGCIIITGDAYYPRAPDHTSVLGTMTVYQIFRNSQCLNDLRVRIYELGAWTFRLCTGHKVLTISNRRRYDVMIRYHDVSSTLV